MRDVEKTQEMLQLMVAALDEAIESDSVAGAMLILKLRDSSVDCLTYTGSVEYSEWAGFLECLKAKAVEAYWEKMQIESPED